MKDGATDKDLLSQLVAQLVIITAYNPSETLDNKTHEDVPRFLNYFKDIFHHPTKRKNFKRKNKKRRNKKKKVNICQLSKEQIYKRGAGIKIMPHCNK